MKKLFLLLVLGISICFADETTPPSKHFKPILPDGLYKSQKSNTFIKIYNRSESEIIIPVVAHRKNKIESDTTSHGVSFDDRLVFKKINDKEYLSTYAGSDCRASINKRGDDEFIIKVNSINECFNKYSQFNTVAPEKDQTAIVEPFLNTIFKLDHDPVEESYFSHF